MKSYWVAPLALVLAFPCIPVSKAEETPPPSPRAAGKDLSKEIVGHWVVDFDSPSIKDFLSQHKDDENLQKEMAATTFEFKDGTMTMYVEGNASALKLAIKSQDPEKKTIAADFLSEHGDPVAATLSIGDNRLSIAGKGDGEQDLNVGLKRIDQAEFEKRVPEDLRNRKPEPGKPAEGAETTEKDPVETAGGFPFATPVPDKPGFVFSPYNRKVLDVQDVPSGTLVADPHFPPSEKKFFRVP